MMILNLINTIAIAIGIGTSVNNTNFNNERKAHRNVTITAVNITESYTRTNYYEYTNGDWQFILNKYYLGANTIQANYTNALFNIYNTTYREAQINNTINRHNEYIYEFYKITSYYGTRAEFTFQTEIPTTSSTGTNVSYQLWKTIKDPSSVIDLTLNQTTQTQISTYINSLGSDEMIRTYGGTPNLQVPTDYITITTDPISLEPNESINLVLKARYQSDIGKIGEIEPYRFTINSDIYVNPITQEVIDIPTLMYTVLSLPFSFISQAFNLTIFPNTPYQLNFTNLFMTIIAVFILLWLIKKILK